VACLGVSFMHHRACISFYSHFFFVFSFAIHVSFSFVLFSLMNKNERIPLLFVYTFRVPQFSLVIHWLVHSSYHVMYLFAWKLILMMDVFFVCVNFLDGLFEQCWTIIAHFAHKLGLVACLVLGGQPCVWTR
jgi:hypothetical protein